MTECEFQKACRIGNFKKIREIIEQNPGLLNEMDKNLGWTPLYRTVTCGHYEATKELLSLGANPNVKNKLGEYPLHQAVESNQFAIVQLLLDNGADSNIVQNDGDSPLHYSCIKEFLNITALLLKYRSNPNIRNKIFGRTPFHYAVDSQNLSIIQLMLKYSASVDIKDNSGITPLDLAEDFKLVLMDVADKETNNFNKKETDKEPDDLSKMTPSFDFSQLSVKADSLIEPECEHGGFPTASCSDFSFGTDPHKNSLYKWLTSMKLENLFNVLYSNGYDDLDFLLAQIRSSEPLTLNLLEKIGINKPGHRAKLLALLEQEAFKDMRLSIPVNTDFLCITKYKPLPSLENWLAGLGLKKLFVKFYENGFEDTDSLVTIMQSNYALTEETLKTQVGIEKLEQRQKILTKLKEEFGGRHKRIISRIAFEKNESIAACEFCLVI